jgi:hypothetical protein
MNAKKLEKLSIEDRLRYINYWKDRRMKQSVFVSMKVEDVNWMVDTIKELHGKLEEESDKDFFDFMDKALEEGDNG